MAEGADGAVGGGGGAVVGAESVARTTTARTSVGTRRWVPVRECLARSEESGRDTTV